MSFLKVIENLKHGEKFYQDLGEGSGAEIYKINDVYVLFSVPMYGGEPRWERVYTYANDVVSEISLWT